SMCPCTCRTEPLMSSRETRSGGVGIATILSQDVVPPPEITATLISSRSPAVGPDPLVQPLGKQSDSACGAAFSGVLATQAHVFFSAQTSGQSIKGADRLT